MTQICSKRSQAVLPKIKSSAVTDSSGSTTSSSSLISESFFEKGDWEVTVEDISSFFNMPAMQTHWLTFQQYYSPDFRKFVNETIMKKAEAPISEAPPEIKSE
ncbi:hypothetical protein JIN85_14055 [Luteolibacter pohnpeiensis]|uniref:Uncharacterized protein n=1 Tax=Luteolibacter pohnpeiensis TaxID=454153 RepID=A0A934S8Z3_9BACT|nr:hypothetical protein [Luteolibacter pohnpeiensis]